MTYLQFSKIIMAWFKLSQLTIISLLKPCKVSNWKVGYTHLNQCKRKKVVMDEVPCSCRAPFCWISPPRRPMFTREPERTRSNEPPAVQRHAIPAAGMCKELRRAGRADRRSPASLERDSRKRMDGWMVCPQHWAGLDD